MSVCLSVGLSKNKYYYPLPKPSSPHSPPLPTLLPSPLNQKMCTIYIFFTCLPKGQWVESFVFSSLELLSRYPAHQIMIDCEYKIDLGKGPPSSLRPPSLHITNCLLDFVSVLPKTIFPPWAVEYSIYDRGPPLRIHLLVPLAYTMIIFVGLCYNQREYSLIISFSRE